MPTFLIIPPFYPPRVENIFLFYRFLTKFLFTLRSIIQHFALSFAWKVSHFFHVSPYFRIFIETFHLTLAEMKFRKPGLYIGMHTDYTAKSS